MKLEKALQQARELRQLCESDPGLWNIVQAESEWALYGDACDPLASDAPARALKALQRDIYLDVWRAALDSLGRGSRVLAAGDGTGRFAQPLTERGLHVELVDASPSAVRRAARHLGEGVPARVGDLSVSGTLPAATYDAAVAVEVACYATVPLHLMQQLRAALKPEAMLLFSVEAPLGALLADPDLASPEAVRAVLSEGVVTLPGAKHVHYYSREQAGALAQQAGFSVRAVEGVCYVPEGPLHGMVDASRLDDAAHVEQLRDMERACRAHPVLRELARAWAVTAIAV